jgi:uncharacterized protein YoxC
MKEKLDLSVKIRELAEDLRIKQRNFDELEEKLKGQVAEISLLNQNCEVQLKAYSDELNEKNQKIACLEQQVTPKTQY